MSIDMELQANLKKAKSGRMMFAFAHKGSSGSLLVDHKISGKDAAQAKEKSGGGTLFRGRCFGEEGEMIFEVAKEPPAALEAALKRTINLEAGLSLKVVVRFAADAEAEVNGQEPQAVAEANGAVPEAPPQAAPIPRAPAPPGKDVAFKNRLKAVQAQLSAAGGPTPDQQMLLNQAFSAAGDKNYEAALDALKEIDGSKKAKKEEPDTLESTTFKRVLADLKPRFDKARAINSDLMPQMGQILSLAKAGRYADALEMLDKLEIAVDRTLASAPKPAVSGDEFKARLKALLPKYNAEIKEDPALLAQLKPLMGQVIAQGNANQFEQAIPLLIQIEKALAAARPGGKAKAAADPDSCMQRLNGLKPAIKAALSAGGPNVARIQTLVSAASGLLKNKDTVQADKVLDELEPLLKPAIGAGAVDLAAEWKAKLAEWSPAIKAALAAKGLNAAAIAKLFAQATALSKPGGDMALAIAKLTECHALATGGATESAEMASEGKVASEEQSPTSTETAQPTEGKAAPDAEPKTPEDRWDAERLKVLPKLLDEIKEVVATKHPKADKAELELKAVMRQLKAEMKTKQQAAEMERYLKDDDVVAAVCNLAFDLKTPLLKVLAEITDQLPA